MRLRLSVGVICCALSVLAGCQRDRELSYKLSERAEALPAALKLQIGEVLEQYSGTPEDPRLIGNDTIGVAHLLQGATVYARRCESCHGVSGDGNGPAAVYLDPRPRDYRRGIFKFTSTPYGARPLRTDLERTVRKGIVGTSMPSFDLLPEDDLQAVIDYVLALTHRGELEEQLVVEAEDLDEINSEVVPEFVDLILERWEQAKDELVTPISREPPMSRETIALGREAFLDQQQGCFKCHGADGRGGSVEGVQVGPDAWGFSTTAADLTSGMLHGGQQPLDVYRRIFSGISGTPMPSFRGAYSDRPDTFWHLVHYVLAVANKRREGEFFLTEPSADEDRPAGEMPPGPAGD